MLPKSRTLFSAQNQKITWFVMVIIVLTAIGSCTHYFKASLTSQSTNGTAAQTARVRRGDLVLTASGSGTLVAQTDASFGFETRGQVTEVYVQVGDPVEAGQVLAQLDDTLAQMDYAKAQQALLELYSAASIAAVRQEIGTAKDAEFYAREWLEYLISPEVLEAEENLAIAQQKLAEAQAEAKANPSEAANQAVKEKEQAVTFLQETLDQARTYYENEYLPENFGEYENVGSRRHPKMILVTSIDPDTGEEVAEINGPSAADLAAARNNYIQAQETVRENEMYLEILETGLIPEDATGEKLTALYEAQETLEAAREALEDAQLIAPIRGTVTALDLRVGEQVEKGSSSASSETNASSDLLDFDSQTTTETSSIITVSQLSQPYTLDIYLDEANWSLAKVGNKVNVTFDLLEGQSFPGTITLVYPELSESSEASLVRLRVQLEQTISQELPAGTGAEVEVVGGEARGVALVPVAAIRETEEGRPVVTVLQNGRQVEREIEIGLQNDTYAEVKSGLEPGESVVTE